MKQASMIGEVAAALSRQPLLTRDEWNFYQPRFESPQTDTTAKMELELKKSHGGLYYRRFLAGPGGCGKSTELTRLTFALEQMFEFVRMPGDDLSSSSAQPFDVLDLMAGCLVERSAELGLDLDSSMLEELHDWFSTVVERRTSSKEIEAGIEVGAGVSTPDLLSRLLKVFGKVRGEAKFAATRTKDVVENRLQRMSDLRDLANRVFFDCSEALRKKTDREWVILIENLDKSSVLPEVLERLFVAHADLWSELRIHFICTIPLWLTFGERGESLNKLGKRFIVDIPVFDADHRPHTEGRRILRQILLKRVSPDLFEPGVADLFMQAAGGNLRDMFGVVYEASIMSELIGSPRIGMPEAQRAVNQLRNEYMGRLGETSAEGEIKYERKVGLLLEIYRNGRRVITDPVLYRLLQSRVVHQYNDTYWYGLPPMMVDILIRQGHLSDDSKGGLEAA